MHINILWLSLFSRNLRGSIIILQNIHIQITCWNYSLKVTVHLFLKYREHFLPMKFKVDQWNYSCVVYLGGKDTAKVRFYSHYIAYIIVIHIADHFKISLLTGFRWLAQFID